MQFLQGNSEWQLMFLMFEKSFSDHFDCMASDSSLHLLPNLHKQDCREGYHCQIHISLKAFKISPLGLS